MPDISRIMDIHGLSECFAEALKEISASGKSLTLATLSKTLSKRKEILSLLEQSNAYAYPVSENELGALKAQIEAIENKRRDTIKKMSEMEHQIEKEKEIYKQLLFVLINLSRLQENEVFYSSLDRFKNLLLEGANTDILDEFLKMFRNQVLKEDVGRRKKEKISDTVTPQIGKSGKKSIFTFGEKTTGEDILTRLKLECVTALQELQALLGEDYRASMNLAQDHINRSKDLENLISQKTYVLALINGYVQHSQKEKDQVTGFLKDVSERLAELEREMVLSSSLAREAHKEGSEFSAEIEEHIKSFKETVHKSDSFESLRSFVETQLTKISTILHNRRNEYTIRIEKAQQESEKVQKNFKNLIVKVIDKNKTLMEEIQKDPLTEIFNRRTYETGLSSELDRFQRYRKPFSLIFFDVDHFKKVNDNYGHDAGDRVLKGISKRVGEILRKPDVFARYGGEEFVVILPETTLENSVSVAEKIRGMIEGTVFEYDGQRVPITISLGVTEADVADQTMADITTRADKLLYRAKAEGRNRVVSDFDARGKNNR